LSDKPEINFEKKTVRESGDSEEIRFPIKEKYVQSFIKGDYQMEKSVQKLQGRQGKGSGAVEQFEKTVDEIRNFIREKSATGSESELYAHRFQIPGDDMVRISLDTELALIREDCLIPKDLAGTRKNGIGQILTRLKWKIPFGHKERRDLALSYAMLEIKVRDGARKRTTEWVADLMSSHLVKEAPRFQICSWGDTAV
jgi:SPX domain protein involved in polyphosphate accumulation